MKRRPPDELLTVAQRIDTGDGKMYVRVNVDDDGQPFEVFADIGSSGGYTKSWTEAITKTISTSLRMLPYGISAEELAEEFDIDEDKAEDILDAIIIRPDELLRELENELWGIRAGDRIGVDNNDDIYSIPDAISIALRRQRLDKIGESVRDEEPEGNP